MDIPSLFYLLILVLATGILYLVPLIPALIEWKTKADSAPFQVNFQDRTIVDYCIRMFRDYIDTHFSSLLEEFKGLDIDYEGKHANGDEYYITGKAGNIALSSDDFGHQKTNKVILFCNQGTLPDGIHFENKMYASTTLETGVNNVLHELVAEGDIHLKRGVSVRQLLLSGSSIRINEGCILQGYTRARHTIHFVDSSQFQYVNAAQIDFGDVFNELPEHAEDVFGVEIGRQIVRDYLVIPSQSRWVNHLVAKEGLTIESHCVITGNIKSHGDVRIESHTSIIGSLITFRLLCEDWITVYQNNAECIEMVPETWPVRIRQIKRWAKGHNQVMFKYLMKVLFDKKLNLLARIDGVFLLFTFLISPLLLLGWILYLLTYFLDITPGSSNILGFLVIISFSGVGNFTIFYEIATAVHLDNLRGVEGSRVRLLPLIYINFFVNMFVISMAFVEQITIDRFKKTIVWSRTEHPKRQMPP